MQLGAAALLRQNAGDALPQRIESCLIQRARGRAERLLFHCFLSLCAPVAMCLIRTHTARARRAQQARAVGAPHGIYDPPFTCRTWPVIALASSEARNTAVRAICSGVSILPPSGMVLAISINSASVLP